MTETPKNPNVQRVAEMPFDKDSVSPLPPFAPRERAAGAGTATGPGNAAVAAPLPDTGETPPYAREEYPGPQTASSGERVEPGRERIDPDRERLDSEKGA